MGSGEFDQISPANSMFLQLSHPGVEHVVHDRSGRQYIRFVPGVPYPDADSPAKGGILLPEVTEMDSLTYLELPDNYVTFAQALNDSIGHDPTPETSAVARSLFELLGRSLSELALADRVIPEILDYRLVLIDRQQNGIRLLPPLIFEDLDFDQADRSNRKMMLSMQLFASCDQAAGNIDQKRALPAAFKGFTETFRL